MSGEPDLFYIMWTKPIWGLRYQLWNALRSIGVTVH